MHSTTTPAMTPVELSRYEVQALIIKLADDLAGWAKTSPGYWDSSVPVHMAQIAARIGKLTDAERSFDAKPDAAGQPLRIFPGGGRFY